MKELTGKREIAYFIMPESPKCVVIFLPGTGASPVFYHSFLEKLSKQNYTVIGYDYPGHGTRREEGLKNFYIPYVLSEIKTLISETKKLTSLPVVVMGSSMGGILAYYLAIEFSGMDAVVAHNALVTQWIIEKMPLLFPPVKLSRFCLRLLSSIFPEVRVSTGTYVRWKYVFENKNMLREFLEHPWCIRRYPLKSIYSLLFYTPPSGVLPEKPVLVITGEQDKVVPVRFQRISADAGGEKVEFKMLKGAGHMLLLEYTERFINEVDAWLKNTLQL